MKHMRNIIILLLFFSAEASAFSLPRLIPYRKDELWGYCDSTCVTTTVRIPGTFSSATSICTARLIGKNNACGY